MRDYWFTQELLKAAGFGYIAICVIALGVALWLPNRGWMKALMATIVLGIASILPFIAVQEKKQEQVQVDEYKKRYDEAKAVFDEKCKTAGEKIYKTVDNVEGILLLNVRKAHFVKDAYDSNRDPNWPDAGHPYEFGGNSYIRSFLEYEYASDPVEKMNPIGRGELKISTNPREIWFSNGYRYVDIKQEDGKTSRILRPSDAYATLSGNPPIGQPARYAVKFENSLDPEERKYWVAGTKVKIIDIQTGEVLAERQAYAFEPGLGSTASFRMPWQFSSICPSKLGDSKRTPTRFFVDQVLKPIQESK